MTLKGFRAVGRLTKHVVAWVVAGVLCGGCSKVSKDLVAQAVDAELSTLNAMVSELDAAAKRVESAPEGQEAILETADRLQADVGEFFKELQANTEEFRRLEGPLRKDLEAQRQRVESKRGVRMSEQELTAMVARWGDERAELAKRLQALSALADRTLGAREAAARMLVKLEADKRYGDKPRADR